MPGIPPRHPGQESAIDPPALSLAFAVRTTAEVVPLLDAVASALASLRYPARDVFCVRLALEEALANALKHGHGYDPSKTVRVRCEATSEQVVVEVEDEGPGFDPAGVPDPREPENLERPCGRGLLLMRHYLEVDYNERGNAVTLRKCRSRP